MLCSYNRTEPKVHAHMTRRVQTCLLRKRAYDKIGIKNRVNRTISLFKHVYLGRGPAYDRIGIKNRVNRTIILFSMAMWYTTTCMYDIINPVPT